MYEINKIEDEKNFLLKYPPYKDNRYNFQYNCNKTILQNFLNLKNKKELKFHLHVKLDQKITKIFIYNDMVSAS